jgi:DNA-binding transcriptional regulator YhcF (GntR family)
MSDSFPFTIWSGLLSPEHYRRMGSAIWVFLALVDKITFEEDGRGYVYRGGPIPSSRIAQQLGITVRHTQKALHKLHQHGYIEMKRTRHGFSIVVLRSKKRWQPAHPQNEEKVHSRQERYEENCVSDRKKTASQTAPFVPVRANRCSTLSEQKVTSPRSHDMYHDITDDSTKDSTTTQPTDHFFQIIRDLPETEQNNLAARALERIQNTPFGKGFVYRRDGTTRLSPTPGARRLLMILMRQIYHEDRAAGGGS